MPRFWRRPNQSRIGLGERGERLAAKELERRGYRILERRWRCRIGEIDLVARDGETLVFIEVKTRRGPTRNGAGAGPMPQDSVGYRKRRKLIRLVHAYLAAKRLPEPDTDVRIDVVGVTVWESGDVHIDLIQNAFGDG